jgi:hypothetical protein
MDSDSIDYLGDGSGGPAPDWTPRIKTITAALLAPLGFGRVGWPCPRRAVRPVVAGLAASAVIMMPVAPRLLVASAVAVASRPADTWTVHPNGDRV